MILLKAKFPERSNVVEKILEGNKRVSKKKKTIDKCLRNSVRNRKTRDTLTNLGRKFILSTCCRYSTGSRPDLPLTRRPVANTNTTRNEKKPSGANVRAVEQIIIAGGRDERRTGRTAAVLDGKN